ncbi:MAG: endonuclease NucS domain-containing protein [Microcoleaceae cyanobacterium]
MSLHDNSSTGHNITSVVMLRRVGLGWEFETEEILEDFVCQYLSLLFQWKVLERQYTVNGQRCDVLAVDQNQRLVIIELKNIEDRGIVQQLTRYYDTLIEEQPFCQQVSYEKPVHLVAIAPSFHRDNFIDQKYHTLEFQFLQFSVISEQEKFHLSLQDTDLVEISRVEIPYQKSEDYDLPSPPSAFLKYLANFNQLQKENILKFRRKILQFDCRMQEVYSSGSVKYGNGSAKSSKYCAEFLLDKKYGLTLFLWLPYKGGKSQRIGRARMWTDWQDKALIEGYVSSGIGTEINKRKTMINSLINKIEYNEKKPRNYFNYVTYGEYHRLYLYLSKKMTIRYVKLVNQISRDIENDKVVSRSDLNLLELHKKLLKQQVNIDYKLNASPDQSLNTLLDLTLERWLNRL